MDATRRANRRGVNRPFGSHVGEKTQGGAKDDAVYAPGVTHSSEKTTVLLIDGHNAVLSVMARRMKAVPDMELVGETGSLSRGLDMAARLKPGLIIADFGVSGAYAAARLSRIKQVSPESMVVVCTPYADEEMRQMYADAGAEACLLKDIGFDGLIGELRSLVAKVGPSRASRPVQPAPESGE